ncbi:DUF3108 domain-containing protein [Phaeovulum vinaykumarii]|uniref:DUF3108 domain-containing protein n=1 Tax=Phaeovulum vinaykumarii TaxID=407234 RepID=A0A1N7L1M3_9RHOB|nr:DUF3108 domain-containing protein [Phaeovulum vinaykumarii]SIS67755.1 Protein of unknown function [Phaeovulum vinaykumarii]SOC00570.1 uncharacterized protein DUF3108 [Phaeovulum vinaykumarii]
MTSPRLEDRWRALRRTLLPLVLGGLALAPAAAPAEQIGFALSLRGIQAGELLMNGKVEGRGYAASGLLRTTGLLGMLRRVSFSAQSTGGLSGNRYAPARYVEKADTGKRRSEATLRYRRGVPEVVSYAPPRAPNPRDVDPATQKGTVDPMTAIFAALRDQPAAGICQLDLRVFDGRRASRVRVDSPRPQAGGAVQCAGEYRRVAGFSEREMAEKTRFPFTITYEPAAAGMMRAAEISLDTLYGTGRLTRRK